MVVSLDKKEERTPVVSNNSNPFWSEEFTFEDLPANFHQLSVVAYSKVGEKDQPIGQVLFPKALITSGQLEEDQWFSLAPLDVENSVSGDLRIKIACFPPKNEIRSYTFAVNSMNDRC